MEKVSNDRSCANQDGDKEKSNPQVEPKNDISAFIGAVLALDERLGQPRIGKHLREADDDHGGGNNAKIFRHQQASEYEEDQRPNRSRGNLAKN